MDLTNEKIEKLKKLWFLFGNGGKKSTLFNHKYIQGFLEANEDRKHFYLNGRERLKERGFEKDAITDECINEVEKIIYDEKTKTMNK